MDEQFMTLVPSHRTYINHLIEKEIIYQYLVSMETQKVWITFNATNKKEIEQLLIKSPLHRYWEYEIDELFMVDGIPYRLPGVQLN
jgi:hypothetical protein